MILFFFGGEFYMDAPTWKTIEWTNSVSTRGVSVCSGGGPFARSLCLVSLCEYSLEHFQYDRVSTQTFRECFRLLDTPRVSIRFFKECFVLFESDHSNLPRVILFESDHSNLSKVLLLESEHSNLPRVLLLETSRMLLLESDNSNLLR